jgi:hypothetical protein
MKTLLALIGLWLLGSTAYAEPKVCKQTGRPVVALSRLSDIKSSKEVTGGFTIWPTGGYRTFEQDPDSHKITSEHAGCLDEADVTQVKAVLAKATWKFTTAKIKCMVMSVNHTEWTVNDKVVWDDKMCSGKTPDASTQKAIELVKSLETKAVAGVPAVK